MISIASVEAAVMVMEERVDTEAAISSTSTIPTSTSESPLVARMFGTR